MTNMTILTSKLANIQADISKHAKMLTVNKSEMLSCLVTSPILK